jgi:AcrR family transcriptional regulator
VYDDETRTRLIEEAADLLSREGAHALTTRRVAAAAGTTTNALYTVIGGKAELLREVYNEAFRRLAAAFEGIARTGDPLEDYLALGRAYLDLALHNPALYEVMFGRPAREFLPTPEDAAFAWSTFETNIDAAQRCVDAGIFVGDATELATRMWCVSHGVASLALSGLIPIPDAHAHHEGLCAVVVQGLRVAARGATDPA